MAEMKPAGTPGAATAKPERVKREKGEGKVRRTAKIDDFVLGVHRMSAMIADADIFSKHGVTIGEWATLKAMGDKPEVSLRDVTKGAAVSRQRMRTLLGDLEKKGFIKVARSADKDKRTRAIAVLPKRTEVVNAISVDLEAMAAKLPSMKGSAKRLSGGLRIADKLTSQIRRNAPKKAKGKAGEGRAAGGGADKAARRSRNPDRTAARAKKKAARAAKTAKPAN